MKKRCTSSKCRKVFSYSYRTGQVTCPYCGKAYPRILPQDQRKKSRILIEELDLSVRAYNCLRRGGITTVGDLMKLTAADLYNIRNMNRRTTKEVLDRLISMGIHLEGTRDYECLLNKKSQKV